jgi:hypothetical protein
VPIIDFANEIGPVGNSQHRPAEKFIRSTPDVIYNIGHNASTPTCTTIVGSSGANHQRTSAKQTGATAMVLSVDDELPWDPLWAYVLGEGDDRGWKPTKTRRSSKGSQEEGFLSYINDIIPEPESRDDGWLSNDRLHMKRSDSPTKRGSFGSKDEAKPKGIWRRSSTRRDSASEPAETRESWEWKLDLNNSADDEEPYEPPRKTVSSRSGSFSMALDRTKQAEKQSIKKQSSNEEWQWKLDLDPEVDSREASNVSTKKNNVNRRTQKNGGRSKSSRLQKDPSSSESWDWPSITGSANAKEDPKKGRRGLWRGREKKSSETWDWPLGTDEKVTKKGERRVRFARTPKKQNDGKWVDADEVAEQIERSHLTLLEWVGLNGSSSSSLDTFDEVSYDRGTSRLDAKRDKGAAHQRTRTRGTKLEKKDLAVPPTSPDGFVFGSLFSNWGDLSSEDDSTLNSSTTQDSSAVSTEDISEDGTKSTQQSDGPPSVANERSKQDVTEVRLAYQPEVPETSSTNLLPIITEEGSLEETHFYSDERSGSGSEQTQKLRGAGRLEGPRLLDAGESFPIDTSSHHRIGRCNSILEGVESAALNHEDVFVEELLLEDDLVDEAGKAVNPTPRSSGRAVCRSVKKLSDEQLKWTAETGVPFHELSQQELALLFPKVRSITDGPRQSSRSLLPSSSRGSSRSGSAHFQASIDSTGPQSLFEYEYETGVHMFVSYDVAGVFVHDLTVKTAQPPSMLPKQILLQVEVRL